MCHAPTYHVISLWHKALVPSSWAPAEHATAWLRVGLGFQAAENTPLEKKKRVRFDFNIRQ